jgi:hypothetical protein
MVRRNLRSARVVINGQGGNDGSQSCDAASSLGCVLSSGNNFICSGSKSFSSTMERCAA